MLAPPEAPPISVGVGAGGPARPSRSQQCLLPGRSPAQNDGPRALSDDGPQVQIGDPQSLMPNSVLRPFSAVTPARSLDWKAPRPTQELPTDCPARLAPPPRPSTSTRSIRSANRGGCTGFLFRASQYRRAKPTFRTVDNQADAWRMVRRLAADAGITALSGCHSFAPHRHHCPRGQLRHAGTFSSADAYVGRRDGRSLASQRRLTRGDGLVRLGQRAAKASYRESVVTSRNSSDPD